MPCRPRICPNPGDERINLDLGTTLIRIDNIRRYPPREPFDPLSNSPGDDDGHIARTLMRPIMRMLVNGALRLFDFPGFKKLFPPKLPRVVQVSVPIPGLPSTLDKTRLVHLSDIHYCRELGPGFLQQAITRTMSLSPGFIAITGDMLHRDMEPIQELGQVLSKIAKRIDTYAVLGNHDLQVDPLCSRLPRVLKQAGIKLLINESVGVKINGSRLYIVGIDDLWEGDADIQKALGCVPKGSPYILLSHNPDIVDMLETVENKPLLVLSGHTHGGQISLPVLGPPMVPSIAGKRRCHGLIREKHTWLHITSGIGMVEPLVRFRVDPEISLLTLEKAVVSPHQQAG
ncbi:MAG: metallophosphoesterase [Deltaproteobacteria bacterium]|nr:metallophosphoesterase [Deltaproteobacteria bacterium]